MGNLGAAIPKEKAAASFRKSRVMILNSYISNENDDDACEIQNKIKRNQHCKPIKGPISHLIELIRFQLGIYW